MRAFGHLGDYAKNPAFDAFHSISVRAFSLFHEGISGADRNRPLVQLIQRMNYIAEASSAALRLNASWALTHPAFSLCRDRYEQCVRFSCLARKEDAEEWDFYVKNYHVTLTKLKNAFDEKGVEFPIRLNDGLDDTPPEIRARLSTWRNTPLDQLARRRDALDGITNSEVDKETLLSLYDSIYRQGSSVSHYDMYSVNMLGLYNGSEGLVLAPDPAMPIVITLHCAIFDIIQCTEALAVAKVPAPADVSNELLKEWRACVHRTGLTRATCDTDIDKTTGS